MTEIELLLAFPIGSRVGRRRVGRKRACMMPPEVGTVVAISAGYVVCDFVQGPYASERWYHAAHEIYSIPDTDPLPPVME